MKIITIKKRSEFLALSKDNFSYYSNTTLVLAKPTPDFYLENNNTTNKKIDLAKENFIRVGYTVTKKIGKAVVRNKCKRRYREIFRELAPKLAINHFDYLILARKQITSSNFQKIKTDLKFCLSGINKLIKNGQQPDKSPTKKI